MAASSVPTANLSYSNTKQDIKVGDAHDPIGFARLDSGYLPRENPCAQCGTPISRPDWIESNAGRTSFLWHCHACDYQFEAIAIYEESHPDSLAA